LSTENFAEFRRTCCLPFYAEFEEAHKRLKKCLDSSLLANQPAGIAYSKGSISICYLVEGKIHPAYEAAQEALDLAEETGDAFIKGMAYSTYGAACLQKGLFDEARTHLLEWVSSYEKLSPISWTVWAYGHLGSLHFQFGEYDDAMKCLKKLTSISENFSFSPSTRKLQQTHLVRAKVLTHDQDIELDEVLAIYQDKKLAFCEGYMARNIGDILLHIDNDHLSDAELWFQKAIEADSKNRMSWQ
jgi:tetratricopeptide (TPR) repeat protein